MNFRSDLVSEVKERADIRVVCESYGVNFNPRGQACCPFHDDRHPSASVKNGRFHCFVCGLHLDCFGFVQKMTGCSFPDSVRTVNAVCGCGFTLDGVQDKQKLALFARQREEREKQVKLYRDEYNARMRRFRLIMDTPVPKPGEDAGNYGLLLAEKDRLEDWFTENRWR